MITKEKIKIFKLYDGDVDAFTRASKKHKKIIAEEDFFLIERFLQDLIIIKNGLASKEFEKKVAQELYDNCDNHEVINELKKYKS